MSDPYFRPYLRPPTTEQSSSGVQVEEPVLTYFLLLFLPFPADLL